MSTLTAPPGATPGSGNPADDLSSDDLPSGATQPLDMRSGPDRRSSPDGRAASRARPLGLDLQKLAERPERRDPSRLDTGLEWAADADFPHSWARNRLAVWLADHGGRAFTPTDLLTELCTALSEEGIPLFRVGMSLNDYHPQLAARSFIWQRGAGTEEIERQLTTRASPQYLASPVKVIHDGASGLRRRLDIERPLIDFPILDELKAEGATDYVAMALPFADGSRHFISWATDAPGGFKSRQLQRLYDLMPLLSLRLELDHARGATKTLLTTYLGNDAARRIIGGRIRRGQAERINAILLFADLRGFTALADTLPPDDVVRLLSEYYECVAAPVAAFGGDIVKMMGDGILAIFPIPEDVPKARVEHIACGAVAATKRAKACLEGLPPERLPQGAWPLRAGFALHAGPITFGNVGSLNRLDYTIVGPAVNEVHRVEQLTKVLGHSVLVTEPFARIRCSVSLTSLGFHALRGVREPKELFTVAE